MTSPSGGSRLRIAPLAVIAALVLVGIGFYPLPLLIPGYAGIASHNLHYWVGAGVLTLGPVLALAAMPFAWVRAVPAGAVRWLRRPPPLAFALIVGVVFVGVSVLVAYYAYHFAPITEDAIAQLWHARILLHGRMQLPADPNFEFFAVDNVIDRGGWYSQFPIGGPLVLALGYLIHAPWLLDPLLGAFTAMALYHFARRAYGETQGRAVAVLFTLAPMILLMSASHMNHVPMLFLTVGALALLTEWERAVTGRRRLLTAGGIGLAVGFAATIRPLDAVVVAAGIGVFQLTVLRRDPRRWRDLLLEILCGVVGVAPLLYANWATTGGVFHFAYEVMWGPATRLGFHVDPLGRSFTPLAAAARAAKYVNELNIFVMQWPVPALLVAVAGLVSMRRATRWDALLLGLFGAQVTAYALYWHDGEFLGPRFVYTVVPVIIVLLARAPFLIADRWGGYWRHAAPLGVMACIGVAWLVPMGSYGAIGEVHQVRASRASFKVDLGAAVRAAGAHHALVFVHEPFSGRLMRRLWGVGFTRTAAAEVFAHSDACSILAAVRMAEADTTQPLSERASFAAERIATYAPGAAPIHALDPDIHISSELSLTPECKAALAADAQYGGLSFGVGLLLEPIDSTGRLDGDVIYAADLDDRNEVLRSRFGDRTWYRAWAEPAPDGSIRAVVSPYVAPALDAAPRP
ncbi:MAG: ArnT family glycosyltransferase [Gemmatimonadaceae bacterium]